MGKLKYILTPFEKEGILSHAPPLGEVPEKFTALFSEWGTVSSKSRSLSGRN